jgi:uncharacterized membrane protein YhaH (DUF805 family)
MGFAEAVRTALSRYAQFTGRARRSEFWWFMLFATGLQLLVTLIDIVLGLGLLGSLVMLALLLPSLAVGVRRLHDTGRSGWWMLFPVVLVPVLLVFGVYVSELGAGDMGGVFIGMGLMAWLPALVFTVLRGDDGPNRFGADPKAVG